MNRRNFFKIIGLTSASASALVAEAVSHDNGMKINLSNINKEATLFIIKHDTPCTSENAEFTGLVKDYNKGSVYHDPMLIRIRQAGYIPYEFIGHVNTLTPVMRVDPMYSSEYETIIDANGASIKTVYEKMKKYTGRF